MLDGLIAALDLAGAAHVEGVASKEDGTPLMLVLVSKDADTIRDIRAMIDAYDNGSDLTTRIAKLEAALIDARDTFAGDENDDRYWGWFNRHEDSAFAELSPQQTKDGER